MMEVMAGYDPRLLIAVLSVLTGSALLLIVLLGGESRFRRFAGFGSFAWVLIPSSAYALAEAARLVAMLVGAHPAAAAAVGIGSLCRVPLGLGWIMYSAGQYRLNGIGGFFPRSVKYFAMATAAGILLQGLGLALPGLERAMSAISTIIQDVSLFYAAFSAFLILRYQNRLPASSWAGIASAVFSLVVYPFASVAELFRHSYPLFQEGVSVLMQAHPAYLLAVCGIIAGFALFSRGKALPEQPALPMGGLSVREREVVGMLVGGASYKEIAHSLHISLATVKSHAGSAYGKLGVRSRFELAARMARKGGL